MINITHWLYIFDNQPHISPNPLQIYVKKLKAQHPLRTRKANQAKNQIIRPSSTIVTNVSSKKENSHPRGVSAYLFQFI